MKARHSILALVVLALGTAACGRGCTCFSGEKTYEKVKGKYEVSLVRKTHWTGGKVPGPVSEFFIHVATEPPIDEPIYGCTHADMTEDEDGRFVGFRCEDTHEKEWTVLRLRGGDRRLRECRAPVGTDDTPDWKKLEPVRASTSRILGCEHHDPFVTMRELAHAVLEDEGSPTAGEYVSTLATTGSALVPDPWDSALNVIDAPARAGALTKLCPALARADGKVEPAPYVRAARHCPLDASGALATLKALIADTTHREDASLPPAMLWAGLLAAKQSPKETGLAVCQGAIDKRVPDPIAGALLGHTHTRCAVVAEWMKSPPCNFFLDCDAGLCTERELAEDIAGWDRDLDGGLRADPPMPGRERAILRAAYAAGPLPRELTIPNQRRWYDLPDAGTLPYCSDPKVDAGAECETSIQPLEICEVRASDTVLVQSSCTIHIDDAHHRLDTPRRACEPLGAKCPLHPCCGDAICRNGVCVEKPVADAASD
ncbi:MAG: hypothetical protein U0270_06580 [Labilithrix sp.]